MKGKVVRQVVVCLGLLVLLTGLGQAQGQEPPTTPASQQEATGGPESDTIPPGVQWRELLGVDEDNNRVQRRAGPTSPWQTLFSLGRYGGLNLKGKLSARRGVDVISSARDGVWVKSASWNGFRVENATGNGFYARGAIGADGFRVNDAGGDGLHVAAADDDGVEIGSAGLYGVWVRSANLDGVRVDAANDYGGYFVGQDGGVYGSTTSGTAGYFKSTSGTAVQADGDVQVNGDLTVTGQVSGFPRPNFDSGWVSVAAGGMVTITHNLGGDAQDYVVDMTFRDNVWGSGIHQITYGSDWRPGPENKGMFWETLTATTIRVLRMAQDVRCQQVRIRIWVYK